MKNLPIKLSNLTEANLRYYNDLHRFQIVSAGRRSRKTLIGDRKMLTDPRRGAFNLKDNLYLFAAPTFAQAKNIYWNKLKRDCRLFSKKTFESDKSIILINGSVLMVVGLDKPERIEGMTDPPIKGIHITEMGNTKEGLWGANIEPLLLDNNGFAIIDGVPEGKNHYYDLALYACKNNIPKTQRGIGAYAENGDWSFHSWFSSDVLNETDLQRIKERLDERTFRQEYEGSFESLEGKAYWAYSEINDTDKEYIKGQTISIGADFNVNPMCWAEGHILDGAFYQFGESILNHANTYEMCEHIVNKYSLEKNNEGKYNVVVFPDSSANSDHTNATQTDIQIMIRFGFSVKALRANPLQKDRVKVFNSALRPMEGSPKYFINKKKCPKTIDDIYKVLTMEDGRLNKKQEVPGLYRVHLTDAIGYLLNFNFPLRENKDKWRIL